MVGRWWKWLSWQFTDKLDSNLWSVDGESDCCDSLRTNSIQNIGEYRIRRNKQTVRSKSYKKNSYQKKKKVFFLKA